MLLSTLYTCNIKTLIRFTDLNISNYFFKRIYTIDKQQIYCVTYNFCVTSNQKGYADYRCIMNKCNLPVTVKSNFSMN